MIAFLGIGRRTRIVHRGALAIGVLCAIACTVIFVPAGVAQANSLNCGTLGTYFDGYYGNPGAGNTEGAYAAITARDVSECNNSSLSDYWNRSLAWAMIAGDSSTDGWVQSGYWHSYGGCVVFFAEALQNTSLGADTKVGNNCVTTGGSQHRFEEDYGTGCGCEYAKIDGTVWITSQFNPFNYWKYPFNPEFLGEAKYTQSDIAGAAASPTSYTNLQGQNGSDNNYYDFSCNGFLLKHNDGAAERSDGNAWWDQLSTCPAFNIYTAPAGN